MPDTPGLLVSCCRVTWKVGGGQGEHCKTSCARSHAKIKQYFANYSFLKKVETNVLQFKNKCVSGSRDQFLIHVTIGTTIGRIYLSTLLCR